jgi:hypothetical protein
MARFKLLLLGSIMPDCCMHLILPVDLPWGRLIMTVRGPITYAVGVCLTAEPAAEGLSSRFSSRIFDSSLWRGLTTCYEVTWRVATVLGSPECCAAIGLYLLPS